MSNNRMRATLATDALRAIEDAVHGEWPEAVGDGYLVRIQAAATVYAAQITAGMLSDIDDAVTRLGPV